MYSEKPTPLLFAFDLRFLAEHPESVDWYAAMTAIGVAEFFEIYREAAKSGQRESNPHGQLGRLELYH